jgi:hypothetical protein
MNNKQINTNNKFGRVMAVPSLCELYPGICLTTEEKARKNLSEGSRRDSKNAHYQYTHTLQIPPIRHPHITNPVALTPASLTTSEYFCYI